MNFFKIKLKTIPIFLFAHGYKSDHYNIDTNYMPRLLEIAYTEQGDIIRTDNNGTELVIPTSSIFCFSHNQVYHFHTNAPLQHHFTIGFLADYELELLSAKEVVRLPPSRKEEMTVILPELMTIRNENTEIEKRIKKIILLFSTGESIETLQCTGILFELLAEITQYAMEQATAEWEKRTKFSNNIYCQRTALYISNHMNEKIYVGKVAEHLGISYGYLSKIIRETLGMTLIDDINQIKLNRVKELFITKKVTLKEAGKSVGITDENYLSRIFKKYNGITAAEYKTLHNNASATVVETVATFRTTKNSTN